MAFVLGLWPMFQWVEVLVRWQETLGMYAWRGIEAHGYIAVFKHPFFAVTGKGGSFEIPNLPPGTYTITAWHEKLGSSFQKVTVGEGETKSLEFVFKAQPGS